MTELTGLAICRACGEVVRMEKTNDIKYDAKDIAEVYNLDGTITIIRDTYKSESIPIYDLLYKSCPKCGSSRGFTMEVHNMPELDVPVFISGDEVNAIGGEKGIVVTLGKSRYTEFPDRQDPTKKVKKLQIDVVLPDGQKRVWSPNMTTQRILAVPFGTNSDKWENRKVKLTTTKAQVSGTWRQVIYGESAEEIKK